MAFEIGETVTFDIEGSAIQGRGRIMGKAMTGLAEFWIVQICYRSTEFMKNLPDTAISVQDVYLRSYHYSDDFYGRLQRATDEIETWPQWKKNAINRERRFSA